MIHMETDARIMIANEEAVSQRTLFGHETSSYLNLRFKLQTAIRSLAAQRAVQMLQTHKSELEKDVEMRINEEYEDCARDVQEMETVFRALNISGRRS